MSKIWPHTYVINGTLLPVHATLQRNLWVCWWLLHFCIVRVQRTNGFQHFIRMTNTYNWFDIFEIRWHSEAVCTGDNFHLQTVQTNCMSFYIYKLTIWKMCFCIMHVTCNIMGAVNIRRTLWKYNTCIIL